MFYRHCRYTAQEMAHRQGPTILNAGEGQPPNYHQVFQGQLPTEEGHFAGPGLLCVALHN